MRLSAIVNQYVLAEQKNMRSVLATAERCNGRLTRPTFVDKTYFRLLTKLTLVCARESTLVGHRGRNPMCGLRRCTTGCSCSRCASDAAASP
eukprot:3595449-Amphidinium_carterae.1